MTKEKNTESPSALSRLFSGILSLSDHYSPGLSGSDIEDNWEFIEILDRELGSDDEDTQSESRFSVKTELDELANPFQSRFMIKCTILSKVEVLERLEQLIDDVCAVLLLSRVEAEILLHHFRWNSVRVNEKWLDSEDEVRQSVGLFKNPVVELSDKSETSCGICREDFNLDNMLGSTCGHLYCLSCWAGYISEAINDGPRCLKLRCPDPCCEAAVGFDMVELCPDEDQDKFSSYLVQSYLDCGEAKKCPAPGCNFAAFPHDNTIEQGYFTCRCLQSFCWSCMKEAHAPVDCSVVDQWSSEISLQSENWRLSNAKPCPQCTMNIDAVACRQYIKCSVCNYEFCWTCGVNWAAHSMYSCHSSRSIAGFTDDDRQSGTIARISLERFNPHYEGWSQSEALKANALQVLKLLQSVEVEMMSSVLNRDRLELQFLVDAISQIVECWQLIKWSFVYGFYLSDDEEETKKQLLKFMLEHAMNLVERLQMLVDKRADLLTEGIHYFINYRRKVVTLTRVARKYLNKIMEAALSGLPEVVCIPKPLPRLKAVKEECGSSRSSDWSPNPRTAGTTWEDSGLWGAFKEESGSSKSSDWSPNPRTAGTTWEDSGLWGAFKEESGRSKSSDFSLKPSLAGTTSDTSDLCQEDCSDGDTIGEPLPDLWD